MHNFSSKRQKKCWVCLILLEGMLELHGKTIFILRCASMESALYWSRKLVVHGNSIFFHSRGFQVAGLVAKGTITQMEFSNLFRELMALPIWKTSKWKPIPNFGYQPEADVKSATWKVPNKGREKETKGKDPKSRQANSPKQTCHTHVRDPLSTKTSISRMKQSN